MEEAKCFKERVVRERPVHEGATIYCNFVLPWRESRAGYLARESRRQLLPLLGDLTPGALRLCSKSNTLFLKRQVALYVDASNLQLARGPAWPEEHDWNTFIAAVEGKSRGSRPTSLVFSCAGPSAPVRKVCAGARCFATSLAHHCILE